MQRITVVKDRNFTVMSNVHLKDNRLSWKAKGLLSYILSLPEDWKLYLEQLKKVSKDGKDSTASAIDELIKYGYMSRVSKRGEAGKFGGYSYTVFENPIRLNRHGQTDAETPTLLNKETKNTKVEKGAQQAPPLLSLDQDGNLFASNSGAFYESVGTGSKKTFKIKISGLFQDSNDIYDQFMKSRGLVAEFGGAEGKSMKRIIAYLIDMLMDQNKESFTADTMKVKVLKSLKYIFDSWSKLDLFYQNQLKLTQISSNLVNIINQIKNDTGIKNNKTGNNQSRIERVWSSGSESAPIIEYLKE